MLGGAGLSFPTNGKRKENGEWRGEAAANVNKREGGGRWGRATRTPMLGVPFRKTAPLGKLRILGNFDKQLSFLN